MDVGDFLSCKRSIVNANGEIGGGEVMSKPTLDLGHAVHQGCPFIRLE